MNWMSMIVYNTVRAGAWTDTLSPRLRPTSACPMGDRSEIFPSDGRSLQRLHDLVRAIPAVVARDGHDGADFDLAWLPVAVVMNNGGLAQHLFDLGHATHETSQIFLGLLESRIVGDITALTRRFQAFRDRRSDVVSQVSRSFSSSTLNSAEICVGL